MGETEGVIKYELRFEARTLEPLDISDLKRWHPRLKAAGLIGQDPMRYGGLGFGNISKRVGQGFLISGTQTGHLDALLLGDYCLVSEVDIERNIVQAHGSTKPSSEALSHAAIYELSSEITHVFHAHSPEIWQARAQLDLPTTSPDVPYGTPMMASEISSLYRPGMKALAMGGHEDGIITFGVSADEVGGRILELLESS
jgi:class II aldolase/adducin N-terminal domain-containing protein